MSDVRDRLEASSSSGSSCSTARGACSSSGRCAGRRPTAGERFADHPRDVAGDPDLLNLTRPEIVADIHDAYFEAGADIATTNTFTATSIGQADYGLEAVVHELNVEGARLARAAADGGRTTPSGRGSSPARSAR